MRRWSALETSLQSGINLIDHSLCILFNFSAGKSNDFDPLRIEPSSSCTVLRNSLWSEMRLAIAFDAKFCLGAIEVEDVRFLDVFPSELCTASLSIANKLPHQVSC